MSQANALLYALNKGLISRLALARMDLERLALSAEKQVNFVPRALGSMMLRPGLKYIATNAASEFTYYYLPFIFANDDTALIEFGNLTMRFYKNDALVTTGF